MERIEENIKVSVLIPVYGVEKYIEQCARSLFDQTMREGIEFIFVNDCTKDRSIEILKSIIDEYPERKEQVRIVNHEKNLGIACARVTAVNESRGEYIIHCDSDDWVEANMYEEMYKEAVRTNADIVGCNFYREDGQSSTPFSQDFLQTPIRSVQNILEGNKHLMSFLWCRLIKRKYYIQGQYKAPAEVSMLEDMIIVVPMHMNTNKVSSVPRPLYHYRREQGGMSNTMTDKKIDSAITVIRALQTKYGNIEELKLPFQKALARFSRPLIVEADIYNPKKWRSMTENVSVKAFGKLKYRISPVLVRLHLDKLNLLFYKVISNLK